MQLTFLAASDGTRMAKSFALSSGIFVTTPYPHVRRFWSFTRNPAGLDQLHALLVTHAEAGHCLLKGALDRPLRHESRAGRTHPNAPRDTSRPASRSANPATTARMKARSSSASS